jgi:hypothetical protein
VRYGVNEVRLQALHSSLFADGFVSTSLPICLVRSSSRSAVQLSFLTHPFTLTAPVRDFVVMFATARKSFKNIQEIFKKTYSRRPGR